MADDRLDIGYLQSVGPGLLARAPGPMSLDCQQVVISAKRPCGPPTGHGAERWLATTLGFLRRSNRLARRSSKVAAACPLNPSSELSEFRNSTAALTVGRPPRGGNRPERSQGGEGESSYPRSLTPFACSGAGSSDAASTPRGRRRGGRAEPRRGRNGAAEFQGTLATPVCVGR